MGRGLSEQQRRMLGVAYDHYQRRVERNREWEASTRSYDARLRRERACGPLVPLPHLSRGYVMLALHGWTSGDTLQRSSVRVYTNYRAGFPRAKDEEAVATISRSEYEVAQASTSRTLTRLIERGLLQPNGAGYDLTEAGLRWCAAWVEGQEAA